MANLKAGTLIGGNLIWNHGNLPLSVSGNTLFINGNKIYTTVDKPTPSEVGAVDKAGDTMTGDLRIAKTSAVLTLQGETNNANAAKINFNEGGLHGGWIGYNGDSNIVQYGYRANSVDSVAFSHPYNSPNMTFAGTLITTAAQSGASNALTRKDYVDGVGNTRVAKAGDTMTGKLTLNYTSAIKVPVGNTSQRGSAVVGDFRYNTDEASYEGHDGTEWQPIGLGRIKYTRYSANFTAVKSKGHLVDTTKAGLIATLPAGARESDFVIIGDGANNASKNPFYIAGYNGDRIVVNTDNCMLLFSFVGGKWVITNGIGENGAIDFPGNLALNGISLTKTIPINETVLVANTWTDTGITMHSIANACGTGYLYGCTMEATTHDGGLLQYGTQIGFITSGYNASTNSADAHEIPITITSHATNATTFKLRWQFSAGSSVSAKLQISSSKAGTLKFRLHARKLM